MNGRDSLVAKEADHLNTIIDKIVNENKYETCEFKLDEGIEKGFNFMGDIVRATLTGTKNNKKEDLKLIIKSVQSGNFLSKIFMQNEVYAYDNILPLLKKLQDESDIPEDEKFKFIPCYGTSSEPNKETVVLKDLRDEDYIMVDKLKPFDYDQIVLVIKSMATLHALGFAAIKVTPNDRLMEFTRHTLTKDSFLVDDMRLYKDLLFFGERAITFMDCEENKSALEKLYSCSLDEFVKKYDSFVNFDRDFSSQYLTMSHGDYWTNNFLFKFQQDNKVESMCVLDWQVMRFTSPVIDISYFVYYCLDEETRDKYWDEILEIYYSTLGERLKQLGYDVSSCYPKSQFENDLSADIGYGVMMCMMLLPLFMSDHKEVQFIEGDTLDEDKLDFRDMQYSDLSIKRLNEIVRHCRKMGFM